MPTPAVRSVRMSTTMPGMLQTLGSFVTTASLVNNGGIWSAFPRKRKRLQNWRTNGRCTECIADRRYAMNRILELFLLEYIGYSFYELDKPSALDVMERVGRGLVEAYQRHEITSLRELAACYFVFWHYSRPSTSENPSKLTDSMSR